MWVESDTNMVGGEAMVRQFLVGEAPAGEALAARAVDQALGVKDGQRVGVVEVLELAPRDRERHRRAGAGAR